MTMIHTNVDYDGHVHHLPAQRYLWVHVNIPSGNGYPKNDEWQHDPKNANNCYWILQTPMRFSVKRIV